MMIKEPKSNDKYHWTKHVYEKMKHYQISEQMIKRIIRNPVRVEEGIVPGTVAAMQKRGSKKTHELWTMYTTKVKSKITNQNLKDDTLIIITAWRYPGESPVRSKEVPIPEDILEELNKMEIYN